MSDNGDDAYAMPRTRLDAVGLRPKMRRGSLLLACAAALVGVLGTMGGCGSEDAVEPADPGAESRAAKAEHGFRVSPVTVSTEGLTPAQREQVGYGSYLVNAVADCNSCHVKFTPTGAYDVAYYSSPRYFLGGGLPLPFPPAEQELYGTVVFATNLTPDPTNGMDYTEDEFVEAMRTGKEKSTGETMYFMPWRTAYRWMTTEDLKAMYAYLTRIPPLESVVGADQKTKSTPLPVPAKYDMGDVERPLPPDSEPDRDGSARGFAIQPLAEPAGLRDMTEEARRQYGRGSYLVNAVAGCNTCHGNSGAVATPPGNKLDTANYLAGGRVFFIGDGLDATYGVRRTMGANLIGEENGYKAPFETFFSVMTEGKQVDQPGAPVVGYPMRWNAFRNMTRDDLEAIYAYITKAPRQTGASDKRTQEHVPACQADADCASGSCNVEAHECVGTACAVDSDCPACQVCTSEKCASPPAESSCVTRGI
uniref:Cytochrome P450 dependent monooxygenase n=1 Tax=Sorangium cellulosum TaxID=56 RepID=A4F5D5_SORCE|nr:cytochrome P450 dependent monooxygenase [Sorangium cellulosum]